MTEKTKAKKIKTDIVMLLDRSGSMGLLRDDAIGGYNTFLYDQQQSKVKGTKFTSIAFSSISETLTFRTKIADAANLTHETYTPMGGTRLHDTLVETINQFRALQTSGEVEAVIFVVLTDGEDNESREFKPDDVRNLIKLCETELNWQFIYLAASESAFTAGSSFGFMQANTAQVAGNAKGIGGAFSGVSGVVREYRSRSSVGNMASTYADVNTQEYVNDALADSGEVDI